MPPLSRARQAGAALTEFAVATLVLVPLCLYAAWSADVWHLAIKAQEASIAAGWDATTFQVHDYRGGTRVNHAPAAAGNAAIAANFDWANSLDSAAPGGVRAGVAFVRASSLSVDCGPSRGSGQPPAQAEAGLGSYGGALLPEETWVGCRSTLRLGTSNLPNQFRPDAAHLPLLPANINFTLCGIGPGLSGCPKPGAALWRGLPEPEGGMHLLLDEWAVEDGAEHPLDTSPDTNRAYYYSTRQFYRPGREPGPITQAVGGFPDQGETQAFRLSYRRGPEGSYEAPEYLRGQAAPHGGAAAPHTGGPWHEEARSGKPDESKKAWRDTRLNRRYLAGPSNPAD